MTPNLETMGVTFTGIPFWSTNYLLFVNSSASETATHIALKGKDHDGRRAEVYFLFLFELLIFRLSY
jgi:hypothetical protein